MIVRDTDEQISYNYKQADIIIMANIVFITLYIISNRIP